ncbi:MAG: hypothetical protein ACOCZG_02680, partial [Halothece sp.]
MSHFIKKFSRLLCIAGLVIGLVVACISKPPVKVSNTKTETSQNHSTEWGYGREDNPTRWGSLSPKFKQCDIGEHQSPIDFSNFVEKNSNSLTY